MSEYTTRIKDLLDAGYDIGLSEYPIFDEAYRAILNQKIINHYYFREIGFETPAMFKFYLNMSLDEIMPYYNQLYRSQLLVFDPMSDYQVTETTNRSQTADSSTNGAGSTSETGSQTDDLFSVNSDTPQNLVSVDNIKGNVYASQAARGDNTSSRNSDVNTTSSTTGTSIMSEQYARTVIGKQGGKNYSELLMDFRKTFLNIDVAVITDLSTCFMGIY